MASPHRPAAVQAASLHVPRPGQSPTGTAPAAGGPVRRDLPLTRRYEVACLLPNGDLDRMSRVAPATPAFEDAFGAFSRGTLVATVDGPVAVEDLLPGTLVETASHGPQPLLWVGAMTVVPDAGTRHGGEVARLTRLAADAFGLGRPMPDLVLGPRARILHRDARCAGILGTAQAFAPARAFADGESVIEVTPASPVRVHHLAFDRQQTILANGIEVESFHPGPQAGALHTPEMAALFLALFPHLDGFDGFGPMEVPRLTAFELESLRAA